MAVRRFVAFAPPVKPDSAWLQARKLKEAALARYITFAGDGCRKVPDGILSKGL
jgi:hypothetical protein